MVAGQQRGVDLRQQPPRCRVGRDRDEQGHLVTEHGQIGDGLTAVGEHRRQIDRDPARIMAAPASPQTGQGLPERTDQTSGVGEIGEQTRRRDRPRPARPLSP